MKKLKLWPTLKYVFGFGVLAVVICYNWDKGLADALQQPIHPGPLALAALIISASLLLTFVRWFTLVRAQDLPFTLYDALRLGMIGNFFNTFLPGTVGGDVLKAAFLAQQQDRRTVAVATVMLDRVIGLCGLVWLVALLGSLFWMTGALDTMPAESRPAEQRELITGSLKAITTAALALVGGSVAFWLLLGVLPDARANQFADFLGRLGKVGDILGEFWRAVWMYRCRGRAVGLALAIAMLGHVGFILAFYFSVLTLAEPEAVPQLGTHFLFVPIGEAIQAGFPTPGGVGGGEFGFGELYQEFGGQFSNGVLGALVQHVINWGLGLLGYLVYLGMRPQVVRET